MQGSPLGADRGPAPVASAVVGVAITAMDVQAVDEGRARVETPMNPSARRPSMRRAALVLAAMLALVPLSGCLGQDSFHVVSIQGTIDGGQEAGDVCELPEPDGAVDLDGEAVYWAETVGLVPDQLSKLGEGPSSFSLLVYADVAVPDDGCGPRDALIPADERADWRYTFGTLGVHVPVELAEDGVRVNGTALASGEDTTIDVDRTAQHPDTGEPVDYNGTLTVTAHGSWSSDAFQVVESPFVSGADTAYWS